LIRRLELAQQLQESVKADSCLTDDDRIRLSNLEAAVSRIQRLADSRLNKLHAAMKLVCLADVGSHGGFDIRTLTPIFVARNCFQPVNIFSCS